MVVAVIAALGGKPAVSIATGSEVAEEGEHEEQAHVGHRHHLSIIGAATYSYKEAKAHPTVGFDYVYRLAVWEGRLGIGAFGEAVFAEETEGVMGLPVYLHPYRGLALFAGPGVQIVTEEADSEGGEEDGAGSRTKAKFLFRFGFGYNLNLGKGFSLMPSIDIDLVRENPSFVFGVGLGRGF